MQAPASLGVLVILRQTLKRTLPSASESHLHLANAPQHQNYTPFPLCGGGWGVAATRKAEQNQR